MIQNQSVSPHQPSVEIRIPLSATDAYLRMLHHFLESLQHYAGKLGRNAKCLILVARDMPQFDLFEHYPWLNNYQVKVVWTDRSLFEEYSRLPHGLNRTYSYAGSLIQRLMTPTDCDIVVLADADLLVVGNFDKAIEQTFTDGKVRGFIAHVSPFHEAPNGNSESWWHKVFQLAGLKHPSMDYQHTGYSIMFENAEFRSSPAYFNYGWIVCDAESIHEIGKSIQRDFVAINHLLWDFTKQSHHNPALLTLSNNIAYFRNQIAFTLAVYRNNLQHEGLPITNNFPLHVDGEAIREHNSGKENKNKVEDIAVFHYLGDGEFNKSDFETEDSLKLALQRSNPSPYGKRFQKCLNLINKRLHGVGTH